MVTTATSARAEASALVLMATHSLEAASQADRIVRMRDGRIVAVERKASAAEAAVRSGER